MVDSLKIITDRFENFIKRTLIPSSTFLFFLMLFDLTKDEENKILTFLSTVDSTIVIVIIFMLFVGLGTLLTIIHQMLYDNFLKGNFESMFDFYAEDKYLIKLREELQENFEDAKATDYLLYQQIKAHFRNKKREIDTSRYVDDAKTIGISFVSMIIVLIIFAFTQENFIVLIATPFIYIIGRELIKSKYRSRAIHLYTVYLDK